MQGDHLGSASLTTDASGAKVGELRYKPYGETRYGSSPTDRQFTGQRKEDASLGSLYDYGARMYSPVLARFISADTIVPNPNHPADLNRYAYTRNNPLKYTDPTGHEGFPLTRDDDYSCDPSSGCRGKLPPITGKCDGGTCQLDPALNRAIAFYANLYGIPYGLLYVTLLTEYMDDRQWYQDATDTYNLGNAVMAGYGGDPEHRQQGWVGLGLVEISEWIRHPENNPGVGSNNIHRATVQATQAYFASNYAGTDMANLVQPGLSLPDIVMTLATTDGNMRYAAAHLRQLADQRTGKLESHINALTVTDEAIIYGAYRNGIIGGYGTLYDYQTRQTPGEMGQKFIKYYYQ